MTYIEIWKGVGKFHVCIFKSVQILAYFFHKLVQQIFHLQRGGPGASPPLKYAPAYRLGHGTVSYNRVSVVIHTQCFLPMLTLPVIFFSHFSRTDWPMTSRNCHVVSCFRSGGDARRMRRGATEVAWRRRSHLIDVPRRGQKHSQEHLLFEALSWTGSTKNVVTAIGVGDGGQGGGVGARAP